MYDYIQLKLQPQIEEMQNSYEEQKEDILRRRIRPEKKREVLDGLAKWKAEEERFFEEYVEEERRRQAEYEEAERIYEEEERK